MCDCNLIEIRIKRLIILMERRGRTQLTAARKAETATPGLILHCPDVLI